MRKYCLIAAVVFGINASTFAQPVPPKSLEDSVIGWMKVYHFKTPRPATKVDHRTYSTAQLAIGDSFANWMQASYIPKGGLGDIKVGVSEKLGLYNQYTASFPQSYGAHAKTYVELKKDASKKLVPFTNSHLLWSVMANGPIGEPLLAYCTPTQYYFILPTFEEQGYTAGFDKPYALKTHPNTKKYQTFFFRNSAIGNEKVVLIAKEGKSPFVKITKGEYLQVTEEGIARAYKEEKKKIYEKEKGNQRGIDYFMKYLEEKHAKRLTCLANNKEKYKNRLQEIAEIFTTQPDIMLENYADVFEGNGGSSLKIPVYKIDPAMRELSNSNTPQWIKVSWHGDVQDVVGKHQHESIINNFNFDYLYNYFFEPSKVNGIPYKPLRSPLFTEAVVVSAASETSKQLAADKRVHFFEDFSTTSPGQKPIGWSTNLALDGSSSKVTTVDGLEGKWAIVTSGFRIIPAQLKKPMPQDFTLTFDVAVPKNFTWGSKGLSFILSKETSPGNAESFIDLRVRPGFDGREGETVLETKFNTPPGYLTGTKWYKAPGFSNDKKINKVTVMISKKGEALEVRIDKTIIAEFSKAIPAAHLFNAMSFYSGGGSGENDKYYISNIKLVKE